MDSASCVPESSSNPQPDIIIVEGLVVNPGDTLVLCTNESLSQETVYQIRGRIMEELAEHDIKLLIVCGASLTKITKEEYFAHLDQNGS